jgi:uncharacterized membrane protein YphA (DoxX/SURF4 family)
MREGAAIDDVMTGRESLSRRVLPWLGHAARIALGLVFLAAGLTKMADPVEFGRQIAAYGVLGEGPAASAAILLIAFETTLGMALLAGFRPRGGVAAAALTLLLFIAIEAHSISIGRTESCGCFGAYVKRTPAEVIVEDLILLALAIVAWFGTGRWRPRRAGAAAGLVAAAAIGSTALAAASPHLPIDPWVTRLAVGRPVDALQLPAHLPSLAEGRYLVALFDVTSPEAPDLAAALSDLAARPGGPVVIALTPSDDEARTAFFWSAAPGFDIYSVDRPLLKRLYRRLPLYFTVAAGRVVGIDDDAGRAFEDLLSSEGL